MRVLSNNARALRLAGRTAGARRAVVVVACRRMPCRMIQAFGDVWVRPLSPPKVLILAGWPEAVRAAPTGDLWGTTRPQSIEAECKRTGTAFFMKQVSTLVLEARVPRPWGPHSIFWQISPRRDPLASHPGLNA